MGFSMRNQHVLEEGPIDLINQTKTKPVENLRNPLEKLVCFDFCSFANIETEITIRSEHL
jgi:hypothetical protein